MWDPGSVFLFSAINFLKEDCLKVYFKFDHSFLVLKMDKSYTSEYVVIVFMCEFHFQVLGVNSYLNVTPVLIENKAREARKIAGVISIFYYVLNRNS